MKTFFKVKITFMNGEVRETTGDTEGPNPPFGNMILGIENSITSATLKAGWPSSSIKKIEIEKI